MQTRTLQASPARDPIVSSPDSVHHGRWHGAAAFANAANKQEADRAVAIDIELKKQVTTLSPTIGSVTCLEPQSDRLRIDLLREFGSQLWKLDLPVRVGVARSIQCLYYGELAGQLWAVENLQL